MKRSSEFKNFFGKYSALYRDLSRMESKLDNLLLYVDFYGNKYGLPAILMQDGSLVLLFKLQGVDYESLSETKREELSYFLRTAFDQLDPGVVISNYLVRRQAQVSQLFNPESAPAVIRYMQEEKQAFWDVQSGESYENRLVCGIRFTGRKDAKKPAGKKQSNLSEFTFIKYFRQELDAKVEGLNGVYLTLKSSFERFGLSLPSKEEIFTLLYEMINQDTAPAYRPDLSLNAQLAHSRFVFGKSHVSVNDRAYIRAINIKYAPAATYAMFLRHFYDLNIKFILKQTFEIFKYEGLEKRINFNQNIALSLSHFDKGCQHYVQDVAEFKEKVTGEKQACLYWNWTIYLIAGSEDELLQNTYQVKNLLKELGSCGLEEVENLKYSIFSMYPGHEKLNKRNRDAVILSSNAGDLLSAFALDKGDKEPIEYFLDRNGCIFGWTPFTERENAWHMAITGPTGGGKSFFANHMILSMLVYQPLVYIIDLSKSFRALFDLLHDEMPKETSILKFTGDEVDFSLNPFLIEGTPDEEQISFCEGLVNLMLGSDVVNDTNRIVIREGLEEFFVVYNSLLKNSNGAPVPPLDVLIPILEQRSEDEAIPNKMKLWTYGRKGQLINTGVDSLKLARYCLFDIDLDPGRLKDELNLITYCIFAKIMTDISRPENQALYKFLILDEAYHFLHIPEFSYYLNRLIRTGRHYKIMLSIITQSINDLINESEWSKGILTNLKQGVFFSGQKNIDQAFRLMQMEDYHIELYNHMNPQSREMLYWSSGGIRRVLQLRVDSFSYWLATTDPDEKFYRKLIKDQFCGGDLKSAILTIIDIVCGSKTYSEKIERLRNWVEKKTVSIPNQEEKNNENQN